MGPQKHLFVWVVTIYDNLLKFRFSQLESEVVRKWYVQILRMPPHRPPSAAKVPRLIRAA